MNHLILVRHGQSQWNKARRFTGWADVDLTPQGELEALESGKLLKQNGFQFNVIHTSVLKRANRTMDICLNEMNCSNIEAIYDWRLNERHYGALQGLNKSETAAKYGEDQVHIWRRSYDIPPPLLSENDERHPKFNENFKNIDGKLPIGESLKNVVERLNPFWEYYFKSMKENPGNHLIVAHSNSLRAIVKILDELSDKEIVSVNIPTGVPLVYTFDNNFNVLNKEYLMDEAKLKEKQEIVLNQGKAK